MLTKDFSEIVCEHVWVHFIAVLLQIYVEFGVFDLAFSTQDRNLNIYVEKWE